MPRGLQLADWFSGQPLGPGEDEILGRILTTDNTPTLRFVQWDDRRGSPRAVCSTCLSKSSATLRVATTLAASSSRSAATSTKGRVYFHRGKTHAKSESWQILSPVRGLTHGVRDINRLVQTTFREATIASARQARFRRIPKPAWPGRDRLRRQGHQPRRTTAATGSTRRKAALNYVANGEIGVVVGQFKGKSAKWKGRRGSSGRVLVSAGVTPTTSRPGSFRRRARQCSSSRTP